MKSHSLKKRTLDRLPLLLSFFLPFGITVVSFLVLGLYPIDDRMILAHDGWHQYYPFFRAFREKLLTGGSLQYTWDVGMGTGYLSLFAYYLASPLNVFSLLVPAAYLRELFAVLTVLKLSLAGLFFGIFLKTVYRKNDLALPFFATLYALCAWAGGYYWDLMWLDTFALLPLLIAGTVSLLRDGRFRLYICALALSLWCNYYIAFFSCIFVLLCFIGFCLTCWNGLREFLRRFVRIGICTVLGVGLSAVLLIPTLLAMQTTYSAAGKEVNLLALNIATDATGATSEGVGLWQVFRTETLPGLGYALQQTLTNLMPPPQITKMTGLPNIFCGFSCVILGIYFCCCRRIKLREKIFNVLLLLFFLLSFIFRYLDYIWHGFHFPNMLPYRFSFLFSFVLVCMAYRAYLLLGGFKKWYLAVILPPALLLIYNLRGMEGVTTLTWILSAIVLAWMIVIFCLYSKKGPRRKVATALLCTLLFSEACVCFGFGVDTVGATAPRSGYPKAETAVRSLLQQAQEREAGNAPFWRTETTETQTLNDGALNGYRGVTIFTSSANVNFNRFSRSLGLSSWPGSNRYAYYESSPFTNLMIGVKYLLDRSGKQYNTDYFSLAASEGGVNLLQNEAYVAPGFMADSALAEFVAEAAKYNPILEQEQMFALATGIEEKLYSHVAHTALEAPDGCSLEATGTSGTQYNFSTQGADGDSNLSILYTLSEDGLYCATSKVTYAKEVKVYCNDTYLFTRNIQARSLFSIGNFRAGDTLRFTYSVESGKDSFISLDLARQNNAVFDKGFAALADEPWVVTDFSDTRLTGTVTAKQDGLFYTSIPYEPGWTAKVDGRTVALAESYDPSQEAVKLTDAVIAFPLTAGMHVIELSYTAPGLRLGGLISAAALLLFIALLILRRKEPLLLPPPERERIAEEAPETPEEVQEEAPEEAPDIHDPSETEAEQPEAVRDEPLSAEELLAWADRLLEGEEEEDDGKDSPAQADPDAEESAF